MVPSVVMRLPLIVQARIANLVVWCVSEYFRQLVALGRVLDFLCEGLIVLLFEISLLFLAVMTCALLSLHRGFA